VVLFLRFLEIWITHDSMVQINVECCVFVLLGRVIVSFMWNWDHSLTFSADGGDPKNKKKTI
jgi:hypothetical protein